MRAESITECEELVYLESSAWGWLARTEFQDVIAKLKSKSCVVVSSISAAEALQNPNVHIRQRVCSVMCQVHSNEAPLLEPPLHLALKAGAAHRAGNNDFLFSESGPSPTLREAICGQRDAPVQEAYNWIQNMEQNAERFLEEIRPEQLDWETQYLDSRVLNRTDFLQLLAEYPPAKELSLSIGELRELCTKVDVWRATAGMLAYIITLAVRHAPKRWGGERPGGADLWQTVYLGIANTFLSEDDWLLDAANEIAIALFPHRRRVIRATDFFNSLRAAT